MKNSLRSALANKLGRRELLKASGIGLLGATACDWLPALAHGLAENPQRKRQLIVLWMSGGPTQTDTFDLKPDHANGGQFKPIATNVSGIDISQHLPRLALQADKLAIVRGLSTKEGDHGRGTYLMRTGEQPGGIVKYPAIGCALAKELGDLSASLPNYLNITPGTAINPAAYGPGLLGPKYAPAGVSVLRESPVPAGLTNGSEAAEGDQGLQGFTELGVDFLRLPPGVSRQQADRRLTLWRDMETEFLTTRNSAAAVAHQTVYERAVRVMKTESAAAFHLAEESDEIRLRYGRGRFGQGCLLARRLIERGVPVVEVALDGWDTHVENFAAVKRLSEELDSGWATLMSELDDRGLLETTTILWMGEFGRTPSINAQAGRDHFPNAWSCVLAGGGIKGGQVHGKTSMDGTEVVEGKVDVKDVLATLCNAVGVDPRTENETNLGRPIKIVDGGNPIKEILA